MIVLRNNLMSHYCVIMQLPLIIRSTNSHASLIIQYSFSRQSKRSIAKLSEKRANIIVKYAMSILLLLVDVYFTSVV